MTVSRWKILTIGNSVSRGRIAELLSPAQYDMLDYAQHDTADLFAILNAGKNSDCIIVDFISLDISISNLLSALSARGYSDCPIIVMIDRCSLDDVRKIIQAGVQDVICKEQLTSQDLIHTVEIAIERCRISNETVQREKVQHESEQQSIFALAASGGGAWNWDLITDTTWWSDEMYALCGVAPGTVITLNDSLALTHENDRERLQWTVEKSIAERSDFWCEYRICHAQRGERWVQARGRVVFDTAGNASRLQGVTLDITERKEAEERLRLNEERLRLATYFAEVGFWDVDLVRDELTWPASVKAMFGISANISVSMTDFYAGLHPDDRVTTTKAFLAACDPNEKAVYDVEYRTIGKEDNVIRWVAAKGRGVFDEQQRCTRVIGTAIDITARKNAEAALRESESALHTLADAMPMLAWMAHADGWIFWYNKRWYEYTGTSMADMEGWGWESVHDAEHLPLVKERWKRSIATGAPFEMTFPLRGADGIFRPFLTRAVPIRDSEGKITRWFGSNTDVSPERAIQARLEASEARLREADQRKDVFLATLAHELRNPLAPIRSAASILAFPSLTADQIKSAQQIIHRQVKHMALLLDDLLDVARITQNKMELKKEKVSLLSIIESAVEAVNPLIEHRKHRLEVKLPGDNIVLWGDPLRLSQIISNLLTNAAKYTDPEGHILLSVQEENGQLRINVTDNGIGISASALPNLFTMFSQVDATTNRSEGGLGIGLALAKALVEMHDGTLEVYSQGIGHGSSFTIHLPVSVVSSERSITKTELKEIKTSCRVLIADDNEDAANTLAILIELLGHEVHVVYGGRDAISAAESFAPDLALVDLGMPDVDGCSVAEAIRKEYWGQEIHLVALTGWGQEKDRLRTAAAGFHQHLTKPVDLAKITALFSVPELSEKTG